jgi:hypothetical protein
MDYCLITLLPREFAYFATLSAALSAASGNAPWVIQDRDGVLATSDTTHPSDWV